MCKRLIYLISCALVLALTGNAFGQLGKGNILFEYYYHGDSGNGWDLNVLLNYAGYPDNPDASEWRTSFEGQTDWRDGYGTRVRGYLYPPQTGDYTFWIATDDQSQLWLSTDETPEKAVQIASVPGWVPSRDFDNTGGGSGGPEQKSKAITLQAGKKYYIWAIMSEGGGGDNLAVAWQGPGIASRAVIEGKYLSPVIRPIDLMATNPSPADGATGILTPLLQWTAGKTAQFHDVYFGTNPTPGAAEFRGRQPFNIYWHVAGLTPGTIYYWRIDEVEPDGVTVHTGDIWSFTSAPVTAYNPNPRDGAKLVATDADLSWAAGVGGISHDVYFGTDQTAVANGTGGTFKGKQSTATYDPGTLAKDTTYYWRIDEYDAAGTKYTGSVWHFRTMPDIPISDPTLVGWWKFDEGAGTFIIDWSGYNNNGSIRGNPQWVDGHDGGALKFDGNGDYVEIAYSPKLGLNDFTVSAWVNIATEPGVFGVHGTRVGGEYTFDFKVQATNVHGDIGTGSAWIDTALDIESTHTGTTGQGGDLQVNTWYMITYVIDNTNHQVRLYLDGDLKRTISISGTALLMTAGESMRIGHTGYGSEWMNGMIDDVRLYNVALTQAQIRKVMMGDPTLAWNPKPADKAVPDVERALPLTWSPGEKAAQHDVYFGTDRTAVANATTASTGIYRGRQPAASYTPPEGVQWGGGPYYWRIDEYNTDGTITTGKLWSFTVADYLIVDDFEDYTDDLGSRIFQTWKDGLGYSLPAPGYPGNGTGSAVGNSVPPYAEQTIIHGGAQSMPLTYDNSGTGGKARYSETHREWASPQDWTRNNVKALTLYVRGNPPDFLENPPGTFTMSAEGTDIWGASDEFRYMYKQLSGDGEIIAKVVSIGGPGTNEWRKAGVMIRETLDPASKHAFMAVTPNPSHGLAFQCRHEAGDSDSEHGVDVQTAPYWVKVVRKGNVFTGYHSPDGINWTMKDPSGAETDASNPVTITMASNVYIGLALTSHQNDVLCMAQFSNVSAGGSVTGAWTVADIASTVTGTNTAEPLYVAVEDNTGKVKVVNNADPGAAVQTDWQEWNINLADFSGAGVNLKAVKKIYIGLGNRASPKAGGKGTIYIDDIRVYPSRCIPSMGKPAADLSGNCVVDYADLDILANEWLDRGAAVVADLDGDDDVDAKDFAVLADAWLEQLLWP